ncbi:unnamed protein product [Nezara viridula]|uniref:Uncharacterized protein n=1 Tax=Nezara viridula TaxID=85310 RepID=A0A9P0HR65_NEZVI|nr:unnamed protein product [Nezara viridula]
MVPPSSDPLSSCLPSSQAARYGSQVSAECSVCRVLFALEAAAFKPDVAPVCVHCMLQREPARSTGREGSEEVENMSTDSGKRKKSSKKVTFAIGGSIQYPGLSVESKVSRCQACSGNVTIVRTASSPSSKKTMSAGAKRLVRSRTRPKPLLCISCCGKSAGEDSLLSKILSQDLLSPLLAK